MSMIEVEERRPVLTWTGVRFILLTSNVGSVLFGAAVVLGLPQGLAIADKNILKFCADCVAARTDAAQMGVAFISYATCVGLTALLYALFVPDTFKDYADLAAFTSWRRDTSAAAIESWNDVNRFERKRRRSLIIFLAGVSLILFGVFLYFALQFLWHSISCNYQIQALR